MSQIPEREAPFQQRFSSPLSFSLSSPPQRPSSSPSPDHGEQPITEEEQLQTSTTSNEDLVSQDEEREERTGELLYQSIQPLVVSDTMSLLNKPWGDKSPRIQVLERTCLEKFEGPMLLELLRRYGRSPISGSVMTRANMTTKIMKIENDMMAKPDLAHRVVGLKILWGQQEPVQDHSELHTVSAGLGEEFQNTSPSVVANPMAKYLHQFPSKPHENTEEECAKKDWRVTPATLANKMDRFLKKHSHNMDGQGDASHQLAPNMVTQNSPPSFMTATSTSANALINLSHRRTVVDASPLYAEELRKPWGEGTGYLCCQCGFVSTKGYGVAVCQCCDHLICLEVCVEV